MSQMFCSFCRRHGREERLPRGWKVSGDLVCCRRCRRQRYRLRSITMAVVEPVGATWQELRGALGESWPHALPHMGAWQARVAGGQPVVRVLLGDRWWELRLRGAWSGGQRAAFEALASGAAAGELSFHHGPLGDPGAPSGMFCRMVAWLPREPTEDVNTPQGPGANRAGLPLTAPAAISQSPSSLTQKPVSLSRGSPVSGSLGLRAHGAQAES